MTFDFAAKARNRRRRVRNRSDHVDAACRRPTSAGLAEPPVPTGADAAELSAAGMVSQFQNARTLSANIQASCAP
jgi:hypothetical protein